jgi:hypothetical protein
MGAYTDADMVSAHLPAVRRWCAKPLTRARERHVRSVHRVCSYDNGVCGNLSLPCHSTTATHPPPTNPEVQHANEHMSTGRGAAASSWGCLWRSNPHTHTQSTRQEASSVLDDRKLQSGRWNRTCSAGAKKGEVALAVPLQLHDCSSTTAAPQH